MIDNDLDLFLALAEEGPAGHEGSGGPGSTDQLHSRAAGPDGEKDEEDLDLFLQLAVEEDDAAPGNESMQQQPVCPAAAALQEQQQMPTIAATSKQQPKARLSGWAPAATPEQAVPGMIPTSRVSGPGMSARPQLQQHGAFKFVGPSPQQLSQWQQWAGARPGVFKDTEQGSIIERLSGLKVKNPLVSSAMLKARLVDASAVKLSQVRTRHRATGLEGAWATICVIGEKSKPRESQSGRTYSIWKVTDLEQTSHSLFLFGAAHGDLWKENVGTLLALFSPKVKTDGDFALSVDSPDQVWLLGTALEFGYCKATKKNGEPCRMPVNATRCPYCPYHIQSEYNRLKPTRRNEFQETNLKTAFRPGLQRGLQWHPGQFAGDGPRTAAARMPVLPTERLECAAEAARGKGSSTGARYLKTVANPVAALAACQEREILSLRRNRLGPGEAPIPLPRASNVVIPATGVGRNPASAAAVVRALGLPAKRKTQQTSSGSSLRHDVGSTGTAAGDTMLLECDLFEDDARQRAIELLRAMGGAPAPDPNNIRKMPDIAAAEARRLKAARLSQSEASPADSIRRRGGVDSSCIAASPLLQVGSGNAEAPAGASTSENASGSQLQRQLQVADGRAAVAKQVGLLGGMLFNPSPTAAAEVASREVGATPPHPSAAAVAVAARGYQPAAPLSSYGRKGCQQQQQPSGRASIMGKLGIKPSGGLSRGVSGGSVGGGSGKPTAAVSTQQQQQQPSKSAFEAAFGRVIEEMERTAVAQTSSRYKSSVEEEDYERIEKMLAVLEKKDEMAQKMDSVKSLTVTAFRCKLCNYTSERRRAECDAHPQLVERVQATKRWWECEHCKNRFSSVGVRYPTKRCSKCQHPQTDFKAVSMYRPAKQYEHEQTALASRDKLMARGVEQKWVSS